MPYNHSGADEPRENPVIELIKQEIARSNPGSFEEVQAITARLSQDYNSRPQSDMGGTSPYQAMLLTRPGWLGGAVQLNERLTLQDLTDAPLFQNARRVLRTIQEAGAMKATAAGAFNRAFSLRMLNEFMMSDYKRQMTLAITKVINQDDVPELRHLRYLLPAAGLLLFQKSAFQLTKKGVKLLDDSKAGEMFALLFRTLCLKINLAAFDGLPDAPFVQSTMGFGFYQFGIRADDWIPLDEIAPRLFLPAVIEMLPDRFAGDERKLSRYAQLRVLRPLHYFGLAEFDEDERAYHVKRVRKSDLFDAFIRIQFPSP